jgi:hypothetical protein
MIKLKSYDRKWLLMVLMILGIFTLTSCATTSCQRYAKGGGIAIKGSVIQVADKDVYLCVGTLDGAWVGQELEVWRTIYGKGTPTTDVQGFTTTSGEISEAMVGKIKITKVLDDHYSMAEVISGEAKLHDIVESKY